MDFLESLLWHSKWLLPLLLSWYIFKKVEFYLWKLPPGPIGVPLLGYAPFLSKDIRKGTEKLKKYGKICSFKVATRQTIVVSDYDTAKELLSHPAVLSRPRHIYDFIPGNGGFTTMNGKQWKMERRYALQAIRNIGLGKELWDVIIQEDVIKMTGHIAEVKGRPMDISQQLSMSAMYSIMALVMGRKFVNNLDDDAINMIYEGNMAVKEEFQNFIIVVFPWLRNFLIRLRIGNYAARKRAIDYFDCLVRKEIKRRLSTEDGDDSTDFIKQYAKQVQKENGTQTLEDISVECLVGNIGVFIATSDTSMASTQWILYIMAAYPEIQAKVQREIDNEIGRMATITWADRSKLPYTVACIREMLRWIVVVPIFVPRCAERTFEFHGYRIPRNSLILANGWSLNRDPKYWDCPDQYRPERFLDTEAGKPARVEGYAPFSFGKRNCPGENIAMMMTFLHFTGIMQKFQVRTPFGEPPDLTPHFSAIFEPRKQELCFTERQ